MILCPLGAFSGFLLIFLQIGNPHQFSGLTRINLIKDRADCLPYTSVLLFTYDGTWIVFLYIKPKTHLLPVHLEAVSH